VTQRCGLLDLPEQEIGFEDLGDGSLIGIQHEGWFLFIPRDFPRKWPPSIEYLISPYTLLAHFYQERGLEGALWVYIHGRWAFFATFAKGRPLFARALELRDERELEERIKEFLSTFYQQEENYFVERIEIFFEPGAIQEDRGVSERLLLPVTFHQVDLQAYCDDPDLASYRIPLREPKGATLSINPRMVLGIGGAILLLLGGYDLYLRYRIDSYQEETTRLALAQQELTQESNLYQSKILKIQQIKPIVTQIIDDNDFLETRIRALFDLVPDDTYLFSFALDGERLLLEGMSRSKESFLGLHRQLLELYPKGEFELTRAAGGWYRFKAIYKKDRG